MITLFRVAFVYPYYSASECLFHLESRFMCEEQGRLEIKNGSSDFDLNLNPHSFILNPSRRHVRVLKILGGLTVLGMCGFNVAMNFPNNEIPIGLCLVICSTSIAMLPLTNELIVETTYPAGEATSTAITVWLAGPLSGVYIALSSLIPYGDQDEYPDSTCREGELQDLSWFLSIMNGISLVIYFFFCYFYRKADQFLFQKFFAPLIWGFTKMISIKVVRICVRKH